MAFRFFSSAAAPALTAVCLLLPGVSQAAGSAPQPTICTRACWGASAPGSISYMSSINRAIVHHTAGNEFSTTGYEDSKANVKAIQNLHMNVNGWSDIGYHFLVDKYGYTFEGRYGSMSSYPRGAHDGTNSSSFGFNAMGYFHTPKDNIPTSAMMNALYNVIAWRMPSGWQPYGSPGTYGPLGNYVGYVDSHRRVKSTACPGDHLHNPYVGNDVNAGTIRAEIKARIDGMNPPYYFTNGKDGWGAESGCTTLVHTGTSWEGSVWTDQQQNNASIRGPICSFTGGGTDMINIRLYPQNGSSANHKLYAFWETHAEKYKSSDKQSAAVSFTTQNAWRTINFPVNHNSKWSGQNIYKIALSLDEVNVGTRWIMTWARTGSQFWSTYDANVMGWTPGNGTSSLYWTNCCGWPGVMYFDQTGNDCYIYSPSISYPGAFNDWMDVRLYIQNSTSSSHDMKLYWKTTAEGFYSEDKSYPVNYTLANNTWGTIRLKPGTNAKWEDKRITGLRLDFDSTKQGSTRYIVDYAVLKQ